MFRLLLQRKIFHGPGTLVLTLSLVAYTVAVAADDTSGENGSAPRALEGKEIFETRCAACHGVDGRGFPGRQLLNVDMPDFTDCSFISREPDSDFAAVIHGGGPARGFSALMPAHGEAPSQADIDEINSTLRDTGDRSGEEDTATDIDTVDTIPRRRRGVRLGFFFVVLIALSGLTLYTNPDEISATMPIMAGAIEGYVAAIDSARFWLDGIARGLGASADG